MKRVDVKLCRECKHSVKESPHDYGLRCSHLNVNKSNAGFLSGTNVQGVYCHDQRAMKWLSPCGMRGALWEPK